MKLAKTHDYCASKKPKLAVVMIHGIASDSRTYDHALKFLEEQDTLKDVRLVTFDLLGSGESYAGDDLEYGYDDQLEALHNSIKDLKIGDTPLVLVGHSLGTFIVTRYADTYPDEVSELILISPPIYTPEDLKNPAFAEGMKVFERAVSAKNPAFLAEKSFRNSMDKIVFDEDNYRVLTELQTPATMICGRDDQFIAAYNLPKLVATNSHLQIVETDGRHGVTRDKYTELAKILEGILHA